MTNLVSMLIIVISIITLFVMSLMISSVKKDEFLSGTTNIANRLTIVGVTYVVISMLIIAAVVSMYLSETI